MQLQLSIVRPKVNPKLGKRPISLARVPRTFGKTRTSLQPYELVGHSVVYLPRTSRLYLTLTLTSKRIHIKRNA